MSDHGSTPDDGLMAVEAYVAGTLPDGERLAVEQLLAADEGLRSYAADLELVAGHLPRAAYAAASDTATRNMSVHVLTALDRRRQRRRWMVAVPATATAVMAVVMLVALPDGHRPPASVAQTVAADTPPITTTTPAPTTTAAVPHTGHARTLDSAPNTVKRSASAELQLAYAVADAVAEDAIDDLVMDDVDGDTPSYSALTDHDIDILLDDWNDDAGS